MRPEAFVTKVERNLVDFEQAVVNRYTDAARRPEADLCCPVELNRELLAAVPQAIIDRDYGCGDPTVHVKPGEVVVDLGSGAGKACYLLSQVVGAHGRVIGVDMNDEMLSLARTHQPAFAATQGFDNMTFVKGRIQDRGARPVVGRAPRDFEWWAHLARGRVRPPASRRPVGRRRLGRRGGLGLRAQPGAARRQGAALR
jgi:SAM-dependent methyltransferase